MQEINKQIDLNNLFRSFFLECVNVGCMKISMVLHIHSEDWTESTIWYWNKLRMPFLKKMILSKPEIRSLYNKSLGGSVRKFSSYLFWFSIWRFPFEFSIMMNGDLDEWFIEMPRCISFAATESQISWSELNFLFLLLIFPFVLLLGYFLWIAYLFPIIYPSFVI